MNSKLTIDSIGWDVLNWGHSLKFLEKSVDLNIIRNALEIGIGSNNGGLSIYLASKNIDVLCTGYNGVSRSVRDVHLEYPFSGKIKYGKIDVLNIDPIYKDRFDLIVFKSVIGGLNGFDHKKNAEEVISQIYDCLNHNGYLFFAENLVSTRFHMYIRNKYGWGKNKKGWNYYKIDELTSAIKKRFTKFSYETKGFLGCFGRNEFQKRILGNVDNYIFNSLLSDENKYIFFCICRK